jgi:hypothetical protein
VRTIPMAVVAGLLAAVLVGQPAHAYVRTSATATATQRVTAGQPLTVSGTTAVFASSAKSGDAVAITATVTNPNAFHRWAHSVTATFSSSSKAGCGSADYRVNGSPNSVGQAVSGGGHTLTVTGLTVTLVTGNCKGSTVTLIYLVA